MKLKSFLLVAFLAPAVAFLSQGCDKCKESGTVTFDKTKQYFSVTYKDTAGRNMVDSVFRHFNCSVAFNDNGGVGNFVNLSEDFSDGKFGPFPYTVIPSYNAKKGLLYDYMFVCKKDTFGTDSFRVKFYAAVDECHEYWDMIEIYKSNNLISEGAEAFDYTINQ